jgi:hypothetical protein
VTTIRTQRPALPTVLTSILLTLGGCAGHFPATPAAGGPPWTELTTANFRLWTDLPAEDAQTMLQEVEDFRAGLLTAFRARPASNTGRVNVIALAGGWEDLKLTDFEALFGGAIHQPFFVVRGHSRDGRHELLHQELVYYLCGRVTPNQPLWYSVGLAKFFETMTYDADKQLLAVGRPALSVLTLAQSAGLRPMDEMWAATEAPAAEPFFSATAWAMVHFLMNQRADQLQRYQTELQRAPAPTPAAAWAAAFDDLTPGQLGAQVRAYLDRGQYSVLMFPFVPPPVPPPGARSLSDAEVHAIRALLYVFALRHQPARDRATIRAFEQHARDEVALAQRQDPALPLAQAIAHLQLGQAIDVSQARRATQQHPDDWLAWALLARGLAATDAALGADAAKKALDLARADPGVTLTAADLRP